MTSRPSWRRPPPRGACQVSPNQHLPWTGNTSMVTATDAGGAGAGAGALPSRPAVASSSLPVGVRPERRWNSMIAPAVAAPNAPSAPPANVMPAAMSEFCSAVTRAPRSPYTGYPAGEDTPWGVADGGGVPPRPSVTASFSDTAPVCGVPFVFWKAISAVRVALPNTPSAPPRSTSPVFMIARCSSLTRSPVAPTVMPT